MEPISANCSITSALSSRLPDANLVAMPHRVAADLAGDRAFEMSCVSTEHELALAQPKITVHL